MSDPGYSFLGPFGLYVNDGTLTCQTVSPANFTNRSWAELLLNYLNAPVTANNIDNVLRWMLAATPPSAWWGIGNDPLGVGPVPQILATIREMETPPAGNYTSMNYGTGGASGAYQFEQQYWQSLTKKFGVGTEYSYAAAAPPAIQDLIAASYANQILQENNNNIAIVPIVWYTGNPQGNISAQDLADNNNLQPSTYQTNWMAKYNSLSSGFPTAGSNYADLNAAAGMTALRLNSVPEFNAIVNALMNNASTADFSAAVVQSSWYRGHYGVPVDGPSPYAVAGRGLDYLGTLPMPPDVTAPSSHGKNVSGNGSGINFTGTKIFNPANGSPATCVPVITPDPLGNIDISKLPNNANEVPGPQAPTSVNSGPKGGGTGGLPGGSGAGAGAGSQGSNPTGGSGPGAGSAGSGPTGDPNAGSTGDPTGESMQDAP